MRYRSGLAAMRAEKFLLYHWRTMRIVRSRVAAPAPRRIGCGAAALFRQYEYEEEMYLSLDGSATIYVNSSIPALNALRGSSFDAGRMRGSIERPCASSSRRRSRASTRVSASRRNDRRFVHVRLEVRRCARGWARRAPFAWSSYQFVERRPRASSTARRVGTVGEKRSVEPEAGLERGRARRVPAAPAEPNRLTTMPARTTCSAATSWCGSSRWPIGCAARR